MKSGSGRFVVALAGGIFAGGMALCAALPASAADVVVPVQVPSVYAHVPRIKPGSPTKQYPFGTLRQDYTPYGMAGVPDRLYFDQIEDLRVARRTVVHARF
jgi:hypothetical protein